MIVDVEGASIHASTGGTDPVGDDPVIVLVHGAGMDSTVWQLQTRYLAHHNFRAVAVDLRGHGRSGGEPDDAVPAMGTSLAGFIDALGWGPVTIVGHSMGAFIALELSLQRPELVTSLVLLGAATTMPVHPDLLEKAANDVPAAAALMAAWSHAMAAQVGLNPTPGMWMIGGQRALVEGSSPGVLSADLQACASYGGAVKAAGAVSVPTTIVIGDRDKMTPPRGARALAELIAGVRVIELADTGHNTMFESPDAVRTAIANPPPSP